MARINFGNLLREVGDTVNPFNGDTDYDISPDVSVSGGVRNPVNTQFGIGAQAPSRVQSAATRLASGGNANADQTPAESPARPTSVLGASTGSTSGVSAPAADMSYFNDQEGQLRDLLARSQNTLNQGLTGLSDSYNREVGGANQQRSRALENYGIQREDSARAKQEAIGQVDTNARTLNDSLRRILGMASGSSSSAYQLAAPNAVARQASGQRGRVLNDYAENDRDVTLAENRATEDFSSLLQDLLSQKNSREQELRAGVLENEQGVNASLANLAAERVKAQGGGYDATRTAQLPYQNEINSRQSQIDSLFERFRTPTLTPKAVNVQTPQLRDYAVDRASINTANQAGGDDPTKYSPYAYFLKRQQDQQV